MGEQNIGVVQSGYAAFGRGDIPGLISLLDADVEWKTPGPSDLPTAGTRRGHEAVADFFRTLGELVEFEHFEPQTFLADGNRVVVLGIDRFKVRGGSGKSLSEKWCHVFTVNNGKIVAFDEYIDTASLAAELKMAAAQA